MDESQLLDAGEPFERITTVENDNDNLLSEEVYISDEDESFTVDRREDVKSLLNFVNLASDNIKASLDRSASCKRAVDHKKYLQKQLQHFTNSSQPLSSFGGPTYPPPGTASVRQQSCVKNKLEHYHCLSTKAAHAVNKRTSSLLENSLYPNEESEISRTLKEDTKKLTFPKNSKLPDNSVLSSGIRSPSSSVTVGLSMATSSDSDLAIKTENDEDTGGDQQEKPVKVNVKVTADLVLMDSLFKQSDNEPGDKSAETTAGDKKSVPLRQRSLPASFWKEPNHPQSTGESRYISGYSLMPYHPQFPAHMLEYNSNSLHSLFRLPHGITAVPYHTPSNSQPALSEFSCKATLTNLEYPKIPLPTPYDEKMAAHLGLCNDISSRSYPYVLPGSSRLLSARDYTNGQSHLPHLHRHCVSVPSGLEHSLHPGRLHGQTCIDCCVPRHQPLSLTSGVMQPPTYCRIPPVNSVLSHRPSLWKPIPTKSISSFPSRYHPFAGVQ